MPTALHVSAAQALPVRSLVVPRAVLGSGGVCAVAWRSLGRAAASAADGGTTSTFKTAE
jgi:hypothetical protein